MGQNLGKLRSISPSPCRAALYELIFYQSPSPKIGLKTCVLFPSLLLSRVRNAEAPPGSASDHSAPNPCQVWVTASGKPISASPQALPVPRKNKNQALLHRFPIAQGYNGLSSECIKWSLTIISSLCACNATASYKWFLMTHAVPRNRVIAI